MTKYCGGKTRKGTKCKRPAGWGTDHAGSGKCKLHGGASLKGIESPRYDSGRYSKYVPKTVQEKIAELDNYPLLDLADELQTQRALIADYLGMVQGGERPLIETNIEMLISWMNKVGVMVERIIKINNETALTSAEIAHLKFRTADLVTKYIDGPAKQRQFIIELFQIEQPKLTE